MGFAGKKRVDERTRTAFLLQLRVISHALLGFARACKSRITKPLSLLRVAACCTVLRSQWYQSGINIALVSTYPRRSPDLSSQSCRPSGLESPAQTAVAGRSVDLDALRGVQELVRPSEMLGANLHVERHGVLVGMDLDDAHLFAVLTDVEREVDQTGLVLLDEGTEVSEVLLEVLEFTLLNRVRADEDERLGHDTSCLFGSELY